VNTMEFEVQSHALLPHLLFSLAYLGILFFARDRRDNLGLGLVIAFCITLGLRSVESMSRGADPLLYAAILSYPSDIKDVIGGADYAIFSLLHPITGAFFNLNTCFILLHLLYIAPLYFLYRCVENMRGVFFLLVGWLLFVNSGLLLLANFFRQGISTILFLAILVAACASQKTDMGKRAGALGLPLLHLASAALVPSLLACKMRHYLLISSASFVILCLAVHFAPASIVYQSDYFFNAGEASQQTQLWIKILTIYAMLGFGYLLSVHAEKSSLQEHSVRRAAVGMLIPTAALLLTSNAPGIGLRYLYYSYALAFLYVASAVSCRRSEPLFKLGAISLCLFGLVTWTYPTVAVLLVW